MFCTSLRRRPSFAAVVPLLKTPPLVLREAQLDTHDLQITLDSNATQPSRVLRVLLLSPSCVSGTRLHATKQRMEHFTALTGGQDVVMVYLLNPPPANSFTSARAFVEDSCAPDARSLDGVYAYAKLQAEMVHLTGLPPLLPLQNIEALPQLLKRHTEQMNRPAPPTKSSATPLDLLQLCSANPPMSQQTAYIVSDLVSDFRELVRMCLSDSSVPGMSSQSDDIGTLSGSQPMATYDINPAVGGQESGRDAESKLKRLRDLVGDQEFRNIIDFWKEEWIAE